MELKKVMKSKKMLFFGSLAFLFIVLLGLLMYLNSSHLILTKQREIEINSIVDYTQFIKEVKNGYVDDVQIDSSKVDTKQLGEYDVVLKYKDETKTMKVKVVDTTPPLVETKSQQVALGQKVDPQDFIESVQDATETNVYFEKDYHFQEEGEQDIKIVVEDTSHNKTVKDVKVDVVKDVNAPTIIASNVSVLVNSEISLETLVTVKDDFDKEPLLTIDKSQLDMSKVGHYTVILKATDASGNEAEKTITVQVIDETRKDEKVVYLTFDDGPSKYTPQVLDILDRYQCKATFFITGMNANYRKYIKIAHDKGHTIGLHTYSHNYAKVYESTDAYFKDLEKVGQLAKDYIGYVPKYIRFPGGSSNLVSKKYTPGIMTELTKMVEDKGYIYYDWNAENGDGYSHMSKNNMLKRATASQANQIMILMHDANGKQNTVDILPQVIEYYQKKGYVFKAIDDSSIVPHQKINN